MLGWGTATRTVLRFTSAAGLCMALLLAVGCQAGGDADESAGSTSVGNIELPLIADIINLSDPQQITYRWSGNVPGGGPGLVVFRSYGDMLRWDQVVVESQEPHEGDFNAYKLDSVATDTHGCIWIAQEGRTRVASTCNDGGVAPSMDATLMVLSTLGTQSQLMRLSDREILGRQAQCYDARLVNEFCVDGEGRVLYLSQGSGAAEQEFIAIDISTTVDPFAWFSERTRLEDDHRPSAEFGFPRSFALN